MDKEVHQLIVVGCEQALCLGARIVGRIVVREGIGIADTGVLTGRIGFSGRVSGSIACIGRQAEVARLVRPVFSMLSLCSPCSWPPPRPRRFSRFTISSDGPSSPPLASPTNSELRFGVGVRHEDAPCNAPGPGGVTAGVTPECVCECAVEVVGSSQTTIGLSDSSRSGG